jgi:hypothetical protein
LKSTFRINFDSKIDGNAASRSEGCGAAVCAKVHRCQDFYAERALVPAPDTITASPPPPHRPRVVPAVPLARAVGYHDPERQTTAVLLDAAPRAGAGAGGRRDG